VWPRPFSIPAGKLDGEFSKKLKIGDASHAHVAAYIRYPYSLGIRFCCKLFLCNNAGTGIYRMGDDPRVSEGAAPAPHRQSESLSLTCGHEASAGGDVIGETNGLGARVALDPPSRIEYALAKQLLLPLEQVTDMAPMFFHNSYVLEVISPTSFTLTHEKNGMRFSSAELRPNGRDFLEQFREAVGKRRYKQKDGPTLPSDSGVEM